MYQQIYHKHLVIPLNLKLLVLLNVEINLSKDETPLIIDSISVMPGNLIFREVSFVTNNIHLQHVPVCILTFTYTIKYNFRLKRKNLSKFLPITVYIYMLPIYYMYTVNEMKIYFKSFQ